MDARTRALLAVTAHVGLRTVDRLYGGCATHATTRSRVTIAALELGVEPPPPAAERPQQEPQR